MDVRLVNCSLSEMQGLESLYRQLIQPSGIDAPLFEPRYGGLTPFKHYKMYTLPVTSRCRCQSVTKCYTVTLYSVYILHCNAI